MANTPQLAKTADEYIERLGDWRGEMISELRDIVRQTIPQADESMIWGQVVYQWHGPCCSLKAYRNQVNIGFWRGHQLPDPHKLLAKSNDQLRQMILTEKADIPVTRLQNYLKAAARLNQKLGDPTRPKTRSE